MKIAGIHILLQLTGAVEGYLIKILFLDMILSYTPYSNVLNKHYSLSTSILFGLFLTESVVSED